MAWKDWENAVEIPDTQGIRFNAATGRNYMAQYGEYAMGGPLVAPGEPTWYVSFEPHANRSNEGAFVRHDSAGNVSSIGNFEKTGHEFRNFLLAAGAGVGAAFAAGAAGAGAGASVTGGATAAEVGGSGAFLGEAPWTLTGTAPLDFGAATTSAASSVASTVKSLYSSVGGLLKPALGLASAFTGGATGTTPPPTQFVPFDQPGALGGVNPLVWVGLAAFVGYLMLEKS